MGKMLKLTARAPRRYCSSLITVHSSHSRLHPLHDAFQELCAGRFDFVVHFVTSGGPKPQLLISAAERIDQSLRTDGRRDDIVAAMQGKPRYRQFRRDF